MAKTVEQIAQELKLSVTTVRLVLGGKAERYRISAKTQARIQEHVERYGYTLNHSARSLKLNKTDTLGLIVPNLSNVFFATLAEKLELRCRRSGYQLVISCTYHDVDYENRLVKASIARNIDGLFVVPSTLENQQHHLRQMKKPLVLLDRDFGYSDNALVESDNAASGLHLAQAMLTAHDAPLWFLAGDAALPSIADRIAGYRQALAARDLSEEWLLAGEENTPPGGYALMRQLIAQHGVPQAFIASSLPVLEGAISALREEAGGVPPAIHIGTFDEHPMLSFLANPVWSMQQDEDAWAEKAFGLMQRALAGSPARERVRVEMKPVIRRR